MRKKRSAIPVQPPKIPLPQQAQPQTFVGNFVSPPEIPLNYQKSKTLEKSLMGESIVDVPSPRETNSPLVSFYIILFISFLSELNFLYHIDHNCRF